MAQSDPYKILGVGKSCSDDELKRAYRKLARKHHPDVNQNSKASETKFKEINEAYEILSDPEKRKQYDMFGHAGLGDGFAGFDPQQDTRFGGGTFRRGAYRYGFGGDPWAAGATFFEDMFGDFVRGETGRSYSKPNGPARGSDLEYNLSIEFLQAYEGLWANVEVMDRRFEVRIPPGVETGSKIRVAGKGGPGRRGGPDGDLYLTVTVKDHEVFRREGNNVYLDIPITVGEAILGAGIEVPGPAGRLVLKIPPGTQTGTSFRFRGKGFPELKNEHRGDFYITVRIVVPAQVDSQSEQLLAQFEQRNPVNPRRGL